LLPHSPPLGRHLAGNYCQRILAAGLGGDLGIGSSDPKGLSSTNLYHHLHDGLIHPQFPLGAVKIFV